MSSDNNTRPNTYNIWSNNHIQPAVRNLSARIAQLPANRQAIASRYLSHAVTLSRRGNWTVSKKQRALQLFDYVNREYKNARAREGRGAPWPTFLRGIEELLVTHTKQMKGHTTAGSSRRCTRHNSACRTKEDLLRELEAAGLKKAGLKWELEARVARLHARALLKSDYVRKRRAAPVPPPSRPSNSNSNAPPIRRSTTPPGASVASSQHRNSHASRRNSSSSSSSSSSNNNTSSSNSSRNNAPRPMNNNGGSRSNNNRSVLSSGGALGRSSSSKSNKQSNKRATTPHRNASVARSTATPSAAPRNSTEANFILRARAVLNGNTNATIPVLEEIDALYRSLPKQPKNSEPRTLRRRLKALVISQPSRNASVARSPSTTRRSATPPPRNASKTAKLKNLKNELRVLAQDPVFKNARVVIKLTHGTKGSLLQTLERVRLKDPALLLPTDVTKRGKPRQATASAPRASTPDPKSGNSNYTVEELKIMLKEMGLKSGGSKLNMAQRWQHYENSGYDLNAHRSQYPNDFRSKENKAATKNRKAAVRKLVATAFNKATKRNAGRTQISWEPMQDQDGKLPKRNLETYHLLLSMAKLLRGQMPTTRQALINSLKNMKGVKTNGSTFDLKRRWLIRKMGYGLTNKDVHLNNFLNNSGTNANAETEAAHEYFSKKNAENNAKLENNKKHTLKAWKATLNVPKVVAAMRNAPNNSHGWRSFIKALGIAVPENPTAEQLIHYDTIMRAALFYVHPDKLQGAGFVNDGLTAKLTKMKRAMLNQGTKLSLRGKNQNGGINLANLTGKTGFLAKAVTNYDIQGMNNKLTNEHKKVAAARAAFGAENVLKIRNRYDNQLKAKLQKDVQTTLKHLANSYRTPWTSNKLQEWHFLEPEMRGEDDDPPANVKAIIPSKDNKNKYELLSQAYALQSRATDNQRRQIINYAKRAPPEIRDLFD